MKNYLILTILCSLLMSYMAFGQAPTCGAIPTQEDIDYLTETREMRQAFSDNIQNRAAIQIPITNHIVRQSNGTGGLSNAQLATAMQELNNFYAQAGIEFYECGTTQFINNDTWYNFNQPDENNMTNANNVPNTINIYHCNSITSTAGDALCGYAYFPFVNRDVILMKNSCTMNGSTLIHELGHYFSLYHTHGKGACTASDELVNGSNCTTAGDDLCDTPADPCLSRAVNGSCTYTGAATDANGQAYNPQTDNIMSYSRKSCRNFMTPEQLNRVAASAMIDRNYLTCESNNNIVTMRKKNAMNYALDGNFGGANAQNIYLWAYNQNNVNQQWVEIDRGGGYYSYQKRNTNYCMDGGIGGGNGQNLYLWSCNSNNQNQQWKKIQLPNGSYRLEKRNAGNYSIDGNFAGANGQNTYLWSSNNNNGNQQWVFTVVGSTAGKITDSGEVLGSTEATSAAELEQKEDVVVLVYPNPFSNNLTIELPGNVDSDMMMVQLMDMTGRMVYERKELSTGQIIQISGDLPTGIYALKWIDEKNQLFYTQKIIKQE